MTKNIKNKHFREDFLSVLVDHMDRYHGGKFEEDTCAICRKLVIPLRFDNDEQYKNSEKNKETELDLIKDFDIDNFERDDNDDEKMKKSFIISAYLYQLKYSFRYIAYISKTAVNSMSQVRNILTDSKVLPFIYPVDNLYNNNEQHYESLKLIKKYDKTNHDELVNKYRLITKNEYNIFKNNNFDIEKTIYETRLMSDDKFSKISFETLLNLTEAINNDDNFEPTGDISKNEINYFINNYDELKMIILNKVFKYLYSYNNETFELSYNSSKEENDDLYYLFDKYLTIINKGFNLYTSDVESHINNSERFNKIKNKYPFNNKNGFETLKYIFNTIISDKNIVIDLLKKDNAMNVITKEDLKKNNFNFNVKENNNGILTIF